MDLSKDPFYTGYVARTVQRNTPKEKETTWGEKLTEVGKSLADTVVGSSAIISDATGLTDNAYKNWFGERTELKGNEGMGAKAWDLMWSQKAWVDVGFAAASVLSG